MVFRKAHIDDLGAIMRIITQAQERLRNQGIDQWQNNYPNEAIITDDIARGCSYVVTIDERIVSTVAVFFEEEVTYKNIYEGQWLNNGDYSVIHRIAVDHEFLGRGVGKKMMDYITNMSIKNGVKSIRSDTHEKNEAMRKVFTNNGFMCCGIIYLLHGAERFAYEKLL